MIPRVLVITRRVLWQLRRDKRTLALILVQPILIIGVFGYAFGGDVTGARVAVANLDRGSFGEKILDHLDTSTVTILRVETDAAAEAALREGRASMGVVIPANYTRNVEAASTPNAEAALIRIYEDNTNPQVTAAALSAFGDAVRDAFEDESGKPSAFGFEERVVYGTEDDGDFLAFFVPGIAAFAIFQLGSLLTVVTLVKERTLGTLPRLLSSPARRWEVVLGYTAAFTLLSILQAVAILSIAVLVFRVDVRGSLALALLTTTLVGVVALGFGILVSGLARTEFQAVQAVFLLSFPNLFLAGIFTPIEAMPNVLRPVTDFVPLSYAVRALRDTLNHGRGLDSIAPELAVLAAFALVFLGIATVSFGKKT